MKHAIYLLQRVEKLLPKNFIVINSGSLCYIFSKKETANRMPLLKDIKKTNQGVAFNRNIESIVNGMMGLYNRIYA